LKKRFEVFLILILIVSSKIHSQTEEWTSRYGGPEMEQGSAIVSDNLGNIYVTGSENGPANSDIVTLKYSSSGHLLWVRTFNGPANSSDGAFFIKLDEFGSVIVTGESSGIGTARDIITIKYSTSGEQLWIERYTSSGNHNDYAGSLTVDDAGFIYVTGESNGDFVTIKYNTKGEEQWISLYGTDKNLELPHAIANDSSGNVFVTGDIGNDSTNSRDIATIKYNSNGILQWISFYNGPFKEYDYGLAIGIDNFGNVYVTGGSTDSMNYSDYVTVKYNSQGVEQWSRRYGGSDNYYDQARSLVIDKSNNIYVTGYATHIGTGYDFTTIKYNSDGKQLWTAIYHNGLNDQAEEITIDNKGNIYVTGRSDGNGTGFDYATVKYDSNGIQQWVKRYDYSGEYGDISLSINIDNDQNVYITGQSNRDILTIKYSQPTSIISNVSVPPHQFKLSQNYPNPFNPVTKIQYSIPPQSTDKIFVRLVVYNATGKEISVLVNEEKFSGKYEVQFDGKNYPSGIYFYSLNLGKEKRDVKKMVLLK